MKKTRKQEIQAEIDIINTFGVGAGAFLIILGICLILDINPIIIFYIVVFVQIIIIIRSIILRRKLKRIR